MLIAQIQNQDPTDPMDPTEIVTQNAQMLASIGNARLSNQMGHFEQVRIAMQAVGKNVMYSVPGTDLTMMGTVTEVDFLKASPELLINGENIPVGNIIRMS